MQVEASATPLLIVEEVEKNQQETFFSLFARLLQFAYVAMFDRLIQGEKLNGCHGCVIQHPSQREHSCVMMDSEEAYFITMKRERKLT